MNLWVQSSTKQKKITIPTDIRFYAVFLYFASSPLSKLFQSLGIPREVVYSLMILTLALAILRHRQVLSVDTILFYMFTIPIVLVGTINNHHYIDKVTNIYSIFLEMLPGYVIVKLAKDNMFVFKKALNLSSYVILIYYIPIAFFNESRLDYMAYAYWIQLPLCIVFYNFVTKKDLKDLILCVIGTIALIIFGARGALLGYVLFAAYCVLFISGKINWPILSALGLLGTMFLINIEKLITWLSNKGIDSRTLLKLSGGEFTTSTTRVPLYEQAEFFIRESLLTGYGPLGSRSVIVGYPYPHSILYEMVLDYGIILGSFIIGITFFTGLYMLLMSKGDYRYLASLFFIPGITRLLVSNSIYYVNYIPITIALYISYKRLSKSEWR